MNTQEYLDKVKAELGITSDYALQKPLKLTRSSISKLRHGGTMSDETAAEVAKVLKMHPGLVMLDMHRERAKTPAERSIWEEIFKGFRTLLPLANGRRVA
ncbi:hypothetical protein RY831_27715 [Noviherbaspirillum sp. CPCC 100848]|uniref:HTH cro/C1-type domain-containing protein n=1 Tax=Noviherbaspirillum album TaxID=3080276 RepID=A0ABU6JIE5_9BURK|nr:hypothetical protein [Noviherbaspirillum sp. CPCC 100848]MEC4722952.1 hypothetical protein [Noviherbaspirillum sp. CPCC 100848]